MGFLLLAVLVAAPSAAAQADVPPDFFILRGGIDEPGSLAWVSWQSDAAGFSAAVGPDPRLRVWVGYGGDGWTRSTVDPATGLVVDAAYGTESTAAQAVETVESTAGGVLSLADEGVPSLIPGPETEPQSDDATASPHGSNARRMVGPTDVAEALAEAPPSAVAATTVLTAGLAVGIAAGVEPTWRVALLRALRRTAGLLLFSRIAQEDVLLHERRAELLEFVKNNPGERVETARRSLGLSNGPMNYHLRVLMERNLVRCLKQGGLARLYPAGPRIVPLPYLPAPRRRLFDLVAHRPGLTQRETAQNLGQSERMVSYHARRLAQDGLVEVRLEGACHRLYPRPAGGN